MDGKYIKLTKPIEVFAKTYTELTMREPTGGLYLRLGEPRIPVSTGDGGGFYLVEQNGVIANYLQKLLEVEGGDETLMSTLLSQLSFDDAVTVKRTLFSFFDQAVAKTAARL